MHTSYDENSSNQGHQNAKKCDYKFDVITKMNTQIIWIHQVGLRCKTFIN